MANTLDIPERTLAQLCDKTNAINVVGNSAGNRASVYQPHVVRVTDHADNDAAETGTDTSKMAIFESKTHGQPWKKDTGLNHVIYQQGLATGATATAPLSGATVGTVTVTNGGTGYINPLVTAVGSGGGTNATFTVTVVKGVITSIVTASGSGYSGTITLTITEKPPTTSTVIYPDHDYSTFE